MIAYSDDVDKTATMINCSSTVTGYSATKFKASNRIVLYDALQV